METPKKYNIAHIAVIGSLIVALILIAGTVWMGRSARRDAETAVHSVSLLYLDELAGRREQVVENNLQDMIQDMRIAVDLMDTEDLRDMEHLQTFQLRMRRMYNLEKFAFVDTDGLIYTADGVQDNIGDYAFDYRTISKPEISIFNIESPEKRVVIAMPLEKPIEVFGKTLCVGFMEIGMPQMLAGVSLDANTEDATFCNIYTTSGVALSNTVLGGLAVEDNLITAMEHAVFDEGYSYEEFVRAFRNLEEGEVSFTYNGIHETLSFVPVTGTDWMLTYLIRESVISDRISSVSQGIINRSITQSLLTVLVLLIMFGFIIAQNKRNARLVLERQTADAESRVKQEEMEHRLALQEKLLEEEKHRTQQDNMITAMAADYRSVYHVDMDADDAVCYRGDPDDPTQHGEGVHFPYLEAFRGYAHRVDGTVPRGLPALYRTGDDPRGLKDGKDPGLPLSGRPQRRGVL